MGNEAHKEPTMEEILASIRKIISDDEFASTTESAAETPHSGVEPDTFDVEDNDVLEEAVFNDAAGEEDVFTPGLDVSAPNPEPEPEPSFEAMLGSVRQAAYPEVESRSFQREQVTSAPEPAPARPEPVAVAPESPVSIDKLSLANEETTDAAAGAIGKLISTAAKSESHTVEGLVRELLRPLLKEWLDQNLAKIVEEKVEAEVQRITRMAR